MIFIGVDYLIEFDCIGMENWYVGIQKYLVKYSLNREFMSAAIMSACNVVKLGSAEINLLRYIS